MFYFYYSKEQDDIIVKNRGSENYVKFPGSDIEHQYTHCGECDLKINNYLFPDMVHLGTLDVDVLKNEHVKMRKNPSLIFKEFREKFNIVKEDSK